MIQLLKRLLSTSTAKGVIKKSSLYTQKNRIPAKEGYREDLDKNFRSKMESNVYRFLVECHPQLCRVEYEPKWFTDKDRLPRHFMYLPDFRCTTHSGRQFYIEVKGVWDKRSIKAIQIMRKYRPDIKIEIVDSAVYKKIKNRFAKDIRGWEH